METVNIAQLETLIHCMYKIKTPNGFVTQAPIIGRWYCHFEIGFDGREVNGIIAQYEGDGIFLDEYGNDVEMSEGINTEFPSYLVLQN